MSDATGLTDTPPLSDYWAAQAVRFKLEPAVCRELQGYVASHPDLEGADPRGVIDDAMQAEYAHMAGNVVALRHRLGRGAWLLPREHIRTEVQATPNADAPSGWDTPKIATTVHYSGPFRRTRAWLRKGFLASSGRELRDLAFSVFWCDRFEKLRFSLWGPSLDGGLDGHWARHADLFDLTSAERDDFDAWLSENTTAAFSLPHPAQAFAVALVPVVNASLANLKTARRRLRRITGYACALGFDGLHNPVLKTRFAAGGHRFFVRWGSSALLVIIDGATYSAVGEIPICYKRVVDILARLEQNRGYLERILNEFADLEVRSEHVDALLASARDA